MYTCPHLHFHGALRSPTQWGGLGLPALFASEADKGSLTRRTTSSIRKETSTCKGFHSTFSASLHRFLIKELLLGLGSLCLLLIATPGLRTKEVHKFDGSTERSLLSTKT